MPDLPDDLLSRPAPEGARLLCLACLDDAAAALGRLKDAADGEALHDFRVALRRLRSGARAYREELRGSFGGGIRRRLCRLADATGAGRDAEVHLAWLAAARSRLPETAARRIAPLVESLETRRQSGYEAAARQVAKRFGKVEAELRGRLASYELPVRPKAPVRPGPFSAALAARIPPLAGALAAQLERVRSPGDEEAGHKARIRAKRLRYLIEPARRGPGSEAGAARYLVERLKTLQDPLGELHDGQLLAAEIAGALNAGRARQAWLRLLREERDRLFARLKDEWLEGRADSFFRDVEALRALLARQAPTVEVERKYLLRSLPEAARACAPIEIEQGWLPGERLKERLRRVRGDGSERYYRTVKLGRDVERVEVEEETDAELFAALWPLTGGRRVKKLRYRVPDGDLVWEVDEFTDRELLLAEVELPSPDHRPPLPDWLAPHVEREVTGEPEYVNVNLAR